MHSVENGIGHTIGKQGMKWGLERCSVPACRTWKTFLAFRVLVNRLSLAIPSELQNGK